MKLISRVQILEETALFHTIVLRKEHNPFSPIDKQ